MKHYLFEITSGDYEGEQYIVGANSYTEACQIANDNELTPKRFICTLTEFEAENSGLDEY